jgi:RHS repeat-associated protein
MSREAHVQFWESARVKLPRATQPSDNLVAETGANGFTATVNNLNQVTQVTAKGGISTFVYDKAGNLLSDGTRTYTWDAENRLLSVTVNATKLTSAFAYDALGRRVAITDGGTTTRYRWCGERICAARTPAGAITARYFSQGEINGTTSRYYATDHLGSVRALMDNTGSAKGTAIYHAYGKPTFTGEIPTFAYAGMFYHGASGLYLTQYRAYDASVGRWISRDPVGELGGMNIYAYALDDPIALRDPSGLCSKSPDVSNPSKQCRAALATTGKDQAGLQRAVQNWNAIANAANAHGIDPALLAAVGVRETDFQNIWQYGGGSGAGVFQIDLSKNPSVTANEAFTIQFAANFAANMLRNNYDYLKSQFGNNFTPDQLLQATAASYNFGTGNISGNPATIDVGTAGPNNYGSNVLNLMSCFQ